MPKYLSGRDLADILKLADFELFELAAMTPPHTKAGNPFKPIVDGTTRTWEDLASGAGNLELREELLGALRESFFRIDRLPDEYQLAVFRSQREPITTNHNTLSQEARKRFFQLVHVWRERILTDKGMNAINRPDDTLKGLLPMEKAIRLQTSKYAHERRSLERYIKNKINEYERDNIKVPILAELIRMADKQYPDVEKVPTKRKRGWVEKLHPDYKPRKK